jgi:transposase
MAVPLLGAVAQPKRLLADKAYDADSLRRWLKHRKIREAIPSTASRRTPYPLDRAAYKRRNVIERMFCKLKNWRPIQKGSLREVKRAALGDSDRWRRRESGRRPQVSKPCVSRRKDAQGQGGVRL